MPIPDFQATMRPLLCAVEDGAEVSFQQALDKVCNYFQLTDAEKQELLPSGTQTVIKNRLSWARTYMKKAGLILAPRGKIQITELGRTALLECPERIDIRYLQKYPEFQTFQNLRRKDGTTQVELSTLEESTPEEQLAAAYKSMRRTLAADLLENIQKQTPAFFEQLVVDLMVKMGYGGSREEAGRATQLTADGGIDGVIYEDRLGLDTIYLQAKRWEGTVGRSEIQKFAGALQGEGATKGVFITTSDYSKEAKGYADRVSSRIVLINGSQLAQLMMDYGLGVTTRQTYEIKSIDSDYFNAD